MKKDKKRPLIVNLLRMIVGLLLLGLLGGGIYLYIYCQPKDYQLTKLPEAAAAQKLTLVAHRGYAGMAPENTAPAYIEAGKAGFDAAECDIYRTKDGVWIITHDINTLRMMNGLAFIEALTYDELLEYTYDAGTNIEAYPDLKICTLAEYLEICGEYGMKPVIELKGTRNTEHYDEIVAEVQKAGLGDSVIYISFHIDNLHKLRELTDAPLYYLVREITDKDIEDALSLGGVCGINFNGNKEANDKSVIDKCRDKGLLLASWTIDKPETLLRLVENGVTTITTNVISY